MELAGQEFERVKEKTRILVCVLLRLSHLWSSSLLAFGSYLPPFSRSMDISISDEALWRWSAGNPGFSAGLKKYPEETRMEILRRAYSATLVKYDSSRKIESDETRFSLSSFFPLAKILNPHRHFPITKTESPESPGLILTMLLLTLLRIEEYGIRFSIFQPPGYETLKDLEIHRKIAEKRKGFMEALTKAVLVPDDANLSIALAMLTLTTSRPKQMVIMSLDVFDDLPIQKIISDHEAKLITFYWQIRK